MTRTPCCPSSRSVCIRLALATILAIIATTGCSRGEDRIPLFRNDETRTKEAILKGIPVGTVEDVARSRMERAVSRVLP